MLRARDETLQYSVGAHEFIWSLLTGTDFPSNPRNDLVFAYISVMLEHQHAICNLIGMKLDGSAAALLRPQIETGFRGLWVNLIASDTDVEAIAQRGEEPFTRPFRAMASELDTRYEAGGWLSGFVDYWATLNGFTHSGLEQLGRRFRSDGHIAPTYPDDMIAELATTSGTISIGIVVPILRHLGFDAKARSLEEWLASQCEKQKSV